MQKARLQTVFAFNVKIALCMYSAFAIHSALAYDGPIIDMHAHLRAAGEPPVAPVHPIGTADLLKLDADAMVKRSALIVIARKGDLESTRAQNDLVLKTARESDGKFFPIVSVHPFDGEAALAELNRVAKLGARIVKLHPNSQDFDVSDPAVAAVVERCGELNLIVLLDSFKPWDADQPGKLLLLAMKHPRAKLILAHMGFSQFRQFLAFGTLKKLGVQTNVWFDLSAIATAYSDSPIEAELVWTLRQLGIDRILFGSDWPVDTPAAAAEAIRHLGLEPHEETKIFHDNAALLLRK